MYCRKDKKNYPDFFAFNSYFEYWIQCNDLWQSKKINADVNIIAGKTDASSVSVTLLNNYCSIYLVVCGEGEETFRDLIHYWETKSNIEINLCISLLNVSRSETIVM